MGNTYIARQRRRAVVIIVVGATIYGLGVLALPRVGAWTTLPSWYLSVLPVQEGENICTITHLPTERCAPPEDICNDAPNQALVQQLSSGIAKAADHVAYWHRTRVMIFDECARSLRRQCQLTCALDTKDDSQFAESRKLLDEERARFAELARQERSTRIVRYDIVVRIAFGAVDVFVAWLAVFLLVRSARSTFTDAPTKEHDRVVARWKLSLAAFAGFGILTAIATLSDGISVDDKLWIGADSWVVSRPVWFCNLASMSGIVIAFAAPVTLLWQLGHRELVPAQLRLNSSDGQCGVGSYMSFLHTWTILSFALAMGPAILWIRFLRMDVSSHRSYLAPVAAGLVVMALLVGRLVTNAILLRAKYHAAIARTSSTWDPDEAKKRPPDPTISFIGENWWKLPATLAAIVLALWQIMEWTGAADTIAAAAGK